MCIRDRVNLFATLKAKKTNGVKPIILSGHTDTVPVSKSWSTDPFKATVKGDKLYGRGSCDMKGFIACTLAFAPIYARTDLNRDIHFCFTFDEETACIGAPILIEELKKRNIQDCICIIGEPTKMKIIDAHKGCYEYTTYFEGLAGHSSTPHKGVSAVEFAARYANKLIELREELKKRAPKDSIFDPPFSTLQVGGIFGGIAHNVIADKCHINWETRPVVKDDGIFVLMDIKCEDDPADNEGPMVPFMYAMSLHFCMTTSLANNGAGLGTVGLPESKVKEYCDLVGFKTVKRIETDHPLNSVFEIRP